MHRFAIGLLLVLSSRALADANAFSVALQAPPTAIRGQAITVAATLSWSQHGAVPQASVTLSEGNTPLGAQDLPLPVGQSATAHFTVSFATAGVHTITATAFKNKKPQATASVQITVTDTATATIGTEGGTLGLASGAFIAIPFGALDGPTAITITESAAPPPSGFGALGSLYVLGPEGTLFSRPITVTLPVPSGTTSASLYESKLSGPGFDSLGGKVSNGFVSSQTPHFSQFFAGQGTTTRTVNGVGMTTWLSASARTSIPIDFGAIGVEALIANGSGGYDTIPGVAGTGSALGTFTIANVPTGEYLLHSGTQYLFTDTNSPDLGVVRGGRADATPVTQPTLLNFSLTNLAPYDPTGFLEFYSTEANDWDFGTERFTTDPSGGIPPGSTSTNMAVDLSRLDGNSTGVFNQIQGSLGDRAIIAQLVTQLSSTGVPYQAMVRAATLPGFDLLDGQSTPQIAVAMSDVSQGNTLSVDFRGTQFVSALLADGPSGQVTVCNNCGGFAGVLAQGGDAQDGFYEANGDPLLLNDTSPAGTDIVSGVMTYGAPTEVTLAGSWGLIGDARWTTRKFTEVLPGTLGYGNRFGVGVPTGLEWVTTPEALQAAPIQPIVSLPRAIQVNGAPFFTRAGGIGTTPTISWSAPSIGSPGFYTLGVSHLFAAPTANGTLTSRVQVASIITPDTSVTLPPGILVAGEPYMFFLTATASTSAASAGIANAPFKSTIDVADGIASSAFFWTAAAPPAPPPFATVKQIQGGQIAPRAISTNSSAVFWVDAGDDLSVDTGKGNIWTANLDGSNPHVIASGQHEPVGIAADDSAVYWSSAGNGTVNKLDLATSAVSQLAGGQNGLNRAILVVNGDLYWQGSGLNVLRAGQTTPVVLTPIHGQGLATDGTTLFFTQRGSATSATGRVLQMPLYAGAVVSPTVIIDSQPQTVIVQTDGVNVYWSNNNQNVLNGATINSIPIAGGAAQTLATNQGNMQVFAIDSTYAYYFAHGILWKVALAGGSAPQILAPLGGGHCPVGTMAVRGNHLYWTDSCTLETSMATW